MNGSLLVMKGTEDKLFSNRNFATMQNTMDVSLSKWSAIM